MTIKRKPTDDNTPEMTLGALAATAWLTIWDSTTKIGHKMQLGTLRAWLVARLMLPAPDAGRVVVTDGEGGIAAGATLEDLGGLQPMDPAPPEDNVLVADGAGGLKDSGVALEGLGGGGGPITIRELDGEYVEGDDVFLYRALTTDLDKGVFVPTSGGTLILVLPRGSQTAVGRRMYVQYGGNGNSPVGQLYLGAEMPDEDGGMSVVVGLEGPVAIPAGTVMEIVKTAEVSFGEGQVGHFWMVVGGAGQDGEDGENGQDGQPGDPGPPGPAGSIAVLSGIYPSNVPGNHLRGADGEMPGAATLTVSVVLRLLGVPTTDEVVVGNFEHGTTTGGWGVGVNAAGFKVWASRNSDGALQESTPTGISAFASYGGAAHFLHRLVMVTLTVSGTTATVWVNGVQAQTFTLAGGLRPAVAGYLTTSRNRSSGTPLPTATAGFCGLSYREAADAALYQRLQFTATQAAGGVIQFYPYASDGGSLYRVAGGYEDAGPGGRTALAPQGYIGTEELIPQW